MAPSLHLLLVEDSEDDAALLVHHLRGLGFDLHWERVETEDAFVTRLDSRPDIILCDYALPQFSVRRALDRLCRKGLDLPLIVVSGSIGEEQAVECLKAGATDYVLKDRLARLGPAVHRALRECRERAERRRAETDLRQRERLAQLSARIGFALTSGRTLRDGLRQCVDAVVHDLDAAAARIWILDPAGQSLELAASSGGDADVEKPHARIAVGQPGIGMIATAKRAFVTNPTGEATTGATRGDGPAGPIPFAGYPLQVGDRAVGVMAMFTRQPVSDFVLQALGSVADIVALGIERARTEEQLRHAQKMESIGLLAGGIAHDFNNLLTVMRSHAQMLLFAGASPEDIRDSGGQIILAADRAANLTRQLLTFSHKQVMQARVLDLNRLVTDLSRMLERILGEDVAMHVACTANRPLVHADSGMLEQVLMNLAVNARDAMPSGGRLTVRTTDHPPESPPAIPDSSFGPVLDPVCLTITDTGTGIAPDILPRIFEPFFTTKGIGKGTGLGLATVYGIVRQHAGAIAVHSEPGRGTEFHILLPRATEPGSGGPTTDPGEGWRPGRGTLLLVEDDPALRQVTRRLLERQGFRILAAGSGVEALAHWRIEHRRIDLLLTDVVMPNGVSGRALAEHLRTECPTLPVIFVTGYAAGSLGDLPSEWERIEILQKPFPMEALLGAIHRFLGHLQTGTADRTD